MLRGKAFAADANTAIPTIVEACTQRISSPFLSVDIVERQDGILRVVEIGDGQVSDLVRWKAERFAEIFAERFLRD